MSATPVPREPDGCGDRAAHPDARETPTPSGSRSAPRAGGEPSASALAPQARHSAQAPAPVADSGHVSRRTLFAATGVAAVAGAAPGVAAGTLIGRGARRDAAASSSGAADRLAGVNAVASRSQLPLGLADPLPAFGHLLAFDVAAGPRATAAGTRRAAAAFLEAIQEIATAQPDAAWLDAAGRNLAPANLQVTPGLGASLLDACGLSARKPDAFVELPAFASDKLDPARCGGDLVVQVGAEDPMRLAGAVQRVMAAAGDRVTLRWSRTGFTSTQAARSSDGGAPRNLMGHHDGTANPVLGTPLWDYTVRSRSSDWMSDGSYLVVRQIMIDLTHWFTESVQARDRVIGRATSTGAPLGGRVETDPSDLNARGADGQLVIPATAHLRLANQTTTGGARIYRRPWNFDDGFDAQGKRQAGLLFLAWQNDVRRGFIPIQQSLEDGHDALSEYLTHIGSAVFAFPALGGARYIGQQLLEG